MAEAATTREEVPRVRIAGSSLAHIWRNYNLSIVLTALFLLSWTLQTWMGWREFAAEH